MTIPFEVPASFSGDLASGSIYRVGALLKERATGKILAHIQETGMAHKIISSAGLSPFSGIEALATHIQLHQIHGLLDNLKVLQIANLGFSIAGVGVSAIGFALINKRISGISQQIQALEMKLDWHFRDLRKEALKDRYHAVYELIRKARQARTLSNPAGRWLDVESALGDNSAFFEGRMASLLSAEHFDVDLFHSLFSSFCLCTTARIECLLLADEMEAALETSHEVGTTYKQLFDPISAYTFACKMVPHEKGRSPTMEDKFTEAINELKPIVEGIRDASEVALTTPQVIEALMRDGISGNHYVNAVQGDNKQPFLIYRHTY